MFNNQYSHLEMFWVAADINCYNGLDYHIQISERFNPARDIVDQFTVAWEDIASLDFILV
jgi:3-polyprenyl-4-hydroxybenzoate decarboxylase